jgi:hypothetical protein
MKAIIVWIVGIVIVVAGYAQYKTTEARQASELWWQQEYARQAVEEQAIAQRAREVERQAAEDLARQQLLLNWFKQEDIADRQEDIADRLKVLERRAQCEQLYRSSYRDFGYSLSQVCP